MARLYRYIFYRLNRQQRGKIRDYREATHSALTFMCFSPMAFQATVDLLLHETFGTRLLVDLLGKWPYMIIVFGLIYTILYLNFGRKRNVTAIEQEFENGQAYGSWGVWIVVGYFVIPFFLLFAVAVMFGQR